MKKYLFFIALFSATISVAQPTTNVYDSFTPEINGLTNENLLTITSLPTYGLAGSYVISGTIHCESIGEIKSATLHYNVDNGNTISEKITPEISSRETVHNFKCLTPVHLLAGNHIIKVWINEINGTIQTQPSVVSYELHIASRAVKRNGLLELFSSSMQSFCMNQNKTLDPLLVKNKPNI